jgi:hypothetical protein
MMIPTLLPILFPAWVTLNERYRVNSRERRRTSRPRWVYTHVLNRGGRGVQSLLDRFPKAVYSESGGILRPQRSA